MDLELTDRPGPVRCAVCHDELASEPVACDGCGTVLHAECRDPVHGCPTIGCRNRVLPVVVEETKGSLDRSRALRLGAVATLNGVLALYLAGLCHLLIERAPPEASLSASPVRLAFAGSLLLGVITLVLASRSWRRTWLGVAALCTAIVWLVVTGPQLFTFLQWSRPITHAETKAFADALEIGNTTVLLRADVDALLAGHDPDRDRSDPGREALQDRFRREQVYAARQLIEDGGSYLVLHASPDDPTVLIRKVSGEGLLSYSELVLARGRDGHATCVEALELRTNDTWGGMYALTEGMSRSTREAFLRVFNPARAGEPEAALAAFADLPEGQRRNPLLLHARLIAAQQLEDPKDHIAALEALMAVTAGSDFLDWELADAKEDHPATLAALDRIDRRVGGDPLLDMFRANVHAAQGESPRAVELALRAAEAVPEVELAWWALFRHAVEARDHARTRAALDRLVVTFGVEREVAEGWLDLTEFFASEEGEKWNFRMR